MAARGGGMERGWLGIVADAGAMQQHLVTFGAGGQEPCQAILRDVKKHRLFPENSLNLPCARL